MAVDELDQLLQDRFSLSRSDLIAALKTLPAHRPWAASLTAAEAQLLDDAGFVEDPDAYTEIAVDVIGHMARLINTAYSAAAVAAGLGVNESRVRQRRLARSLWAIEDNGAWVFPVIQFDLVTTEGREVLKQVRGLDQVLSALPIDLHPTAVAGFLLTPQEDLTIGGQPRSVRDWLSSGGAVEPVLRLVDRGEWAGR